MPQFDVPADVTVEEFFKTHVPKNFSESIGQADLFFLAGKEFSMQFEIDGRKYCLVVRDGKNLEVVEGGVAKPMLGISISEDFWRDSITGKIEGAMDQFTDPSQAADPDRYQALLGTSGTLKLELRKEDGEIARVAMVFNGEARPEVTLKLAMADWISMQKGESDGQTMFMAGKMEFSGDMMFLMSLQSLM